MANKKTVANRQLNAPCELARPAIFDHRYIVYMQLEAALGAPNDAVDGSF
jgi:hypothetical protein